MIIKNANDFKNVFNKCISFVRIFGPKRYGEDEHFFNRFFFYLQKIINGIIQLYIIQIILDFLLTINIIKISKIFYTL